MICLCNLKYIIVLVLIGNEATAVTKNNKLGRNKWTMYIALFISSPSSSGTIPKWGPSFCVSMDLKINSWNSGSYESIFRVAGTKGNCCKLGQRYPALWTAPKKGHIHIAANHGTNGNWWKNVKVVSGKWFRVDISQKENEEVFLQVSKFVSIIAFYIGYSNVSSLD